MAMVNPQTSSIKVLGIDPGKSGGLALVNGDGLQTWPMPMAGNVPDTLELSVIFRAYKPDVIVLEKVHSMPGQGVSSTFTFGRGYGRLEGIAEALAIRVELISPQRWKNLVLTDTAKDKEAAIEYCRRRYPSLNLVLPRCRKPHEGIADAICIAEAGRRIFG